MIRNRKFQSGISLIEVLAATSITVIAAGLVVPGSNQLLRGQRAATAIHALHADLAVARNTAISRRSPVVVCPQGDDHRCSKAPRWDNGWLIFLDPDGNRKPDRPEDILRSGTLPGRRLTASSTRTAVRYQPDGRSAHSNLSIRICENDKLQGQVIVNNLGRVRSTRSRRDQRCPHAHLE